MVVLYLYHYGEYETRTICAAYLSHANALLQSRSFTSRDEAQAKASLLLSMAAHFNFEGKWDDIERLNMEAVRIRGELFGENNLSTLVWPI